MTKITVIIPTYHRPEELKDCIETILTQTRPIHELIIVDDGDLPGIPLEDECRAAGIETQYIKKDTPGVTRSKNAGAAAATGDLLFFLDDDVTLFDDFVEQIVRVFEDSGDDPNLAGVGGLIDNVKPVNLPRKLEWLFKAVFMMSGPREGRTLRSGFSAEFGTTPFPLRRAVDVDFLPGGVCCLRKRVFDEFQFAVNYTGHSDRGEDKEFTYRVSRRYRLMMQPAARLLHHESPKMRLDKRDLGRETVINRYRFFKNLVKRGWQDWPFFWVAIGGYALRRTLIMLVSFNRSEVTRVAGIFEAFGEIARGRADR